MGNNSDKELIEHFISWRKYHRFYISESARLAGRSKAWGTLLEKGKINSLHSQTRDNIKFLLGEQ